MKSHTSDCVEVAFATLCENVGSPYALAAWLLFSSSHLGFLSQLRMPQPLHYLSADTFRSDYLVYSYLRKYEGLQTGVDKKAVALEKWRIAEERCAATNRHLGSHSSLGEDVESAILRARRKIFRVLGSFSYSKVLKRCAMGPGATFDLNRRSYPGTKHSLPISVTPSALPLAKAWMEQDIHWAFSGTGVLPEGQYSLLPSAFLLVDGNKLITVPKDASTDRVICVEPTFNLFLQKGVGSYIRSRLKAFGIDLDDQSRNQQLARLAFSLGYSTLDLSSASDTICCELVKLLLPYDWWVYLDAIRSKSTRLEKDKWHLNSKWSSMGNGYTFELETLIFWSLSPECDLLSVYGDDIVCSRSACSSYITILEGVGFTVNTSKSYVDGPFFESCGKHFFFGRDVTPCFQKETVSSASSYVRAYNRLFRYHDRTPDSMLGLNVASVYWEAYPYGARPTVPHTADDRGFNLYHDPSWFYCPTRGWKCRVLKVPKVFLRCYHDGLYTSKLQDPFQDSFLDLRGLKSVSGLEHKARLSSSWVQPFAITSLWLPPRSKV